MGDSNGTYCTLWTSMTQSIRKNGNYASRQKNGHECYRNVMTQPLPAISESPNVNQGVTELLLAGYSTGNNKVCTELQKLSTTQGTTTSTPGLDARYNSERAMGNGFRRLHRPVTEVY
ncbi:hypothetical protein QAD02_020701 [Eretmocerus hayati]|uniref:Uncharacterized protein n=1 Tax=Eretmocerus hayati TaxID=131215 RepID=A0ACC2PN72_9HYME|nr:hypothetical protein QAD02_020701 [Eretmocerus hayati]